MQEAEQEHKASYNAMAKLADKLVNVMERVQTIQKTGTNKEFGYDFVEEGVVAKAVREAFIANKLVMIPSMVERTSEPVTSKTGNPGHLMQVKMKYTIIDAESGEGLSFIMPGDGIDYGDKGIYKAITGAQKYALMKLCLVSSGDDPERDIKEVPERPPKGEKMAREAPSEPTRMRFGDYDGVPLHEIPTESLEASLSFFRKMITDPDRAKFKRDNTKMVRAIEDEIKRRTVPQAPPAPPEFNPAAVEYHNQIGKADRIAAVFEVMQKANADAGLTADDKQTLHSVAMHRIDSIRTPGDQAI